jgi:bifunctional DNase/RNase
MVNESTIPARQEKHLLGTTVLGISLQKEGKDPVLLLFPHHTSVILPLSIGPMEAFAVSSALGAADTVDGDARPAPSPMPDPAPSGAEGDVFFSPVTHELFLSAVRALGAEVVEGMLIAVGQGPIQGCLHLQQGEPRTDTYLPCRPSDCVAIAVRAKAPIITDEETRKRAMQVPAVMQSLSEDMRTVVAAKIIGQPGVEALVPYLRSLLSEARKSDTAKATAAPPTSPAHTPTPAASPAPTAAPPASPAHTPTPATPPTPAAPAHLHTLQPSVRSTAVVSPNLTITPPAAPQAPARVAAVPVKLTPVPQAAAQSAAAIPAPAAPQAPAQPQFVVDTRAPAQQPAAHIALENDAVVASGQTIVLPTPHFGPNSPTIRIALVRQPTIEAQAGKLDERLFPASGVSAAALAGLTLPRDAVSAVNKARGEDERWSTLLRLLTPDTKVPM